MGAVNICAPGFIYVYVNALSKYRIFLPREWSIIFRALITLDGVGRSLGIDIKVFEILDTSTKEFTSTLINKDQIMMESLWFLKDTMSSLRMWPKHINWFLKEFAKNNYSFDIKIKNLNRDLSYAARSIQFLGHIIGSSSLLMIGVYFIEDKSIHFNELPFMTTFFWILAGLLFFYALWTLRNKNKF